MNNTRKLAHGFSLIELMIVIAIVGILAAVALPSYQNYLISAGRTEGAGQLMDVMAQQESSFRNNLSYASDLKDLGYASSTVESETGLYIVSAAACASKALTRCIKLTATAQGSQASDGNLTLDSAGNKEGNWP